MALALILMPIWVILIVGTGLICLRWNLTTDDPYWVASLCVSGGGAALGGWRREFVGAAVSAATFVMLVLLALGLPSLS